MGTKTWDSSLSLPGLIVDRKVVVDGVVRMSGRLSASQATCPDCGTPSTSCHSRYDRMLSDLPVGGSAVQLRLLWTVAAIGAGMPLARGAIALGGRPGARMMARLAVPWSRDTMPRVLRRGDPLTELPPPARVIGIDDFARRRGHSYGSIVVDLERRQVIDLLPDRQRETGSAQTALINAVIEKAVPALITARDVPDRFHAMMRSKDETRLDPWIAMATDSKLAAFVAGVEADKDAVAAAISSPWSSGRVGDNITRLKSIKCQMYGRAKIDLLKARAVAPARPHLHGI